MAEATTTPQLKVGTTWQQGTSWRVIDHLGKAFVIFEVGREVLVRLPISEEHKKLLRNKSLVEFVFECGKKVLSS